VTFHPELPLGPGLFLLWNLAGFFLVFLDKRRAKRAEWRIRERTFFLWALAFGAAGILAGMYVFRHKTRHLAFSIGMPLIGILNLAGCLVLRQLWPALL
jgi:uncharacterized membrane protein YsdA (DUF1294 family)